MLSSLNWWDLHIAGEVPCDLATVTTASTLLGVDPYPLLSSAATIAPVAAAAVRTCLATAYATAAVGADPATMCEPHSAVLFI